MEIWKSGNWKLEIWNFLKTLIFSLFDRMNYITKEIVEEIRSIPGNNVREWRRNNL